MVMTTRYNEVPKCAMIHANDLYRFKFWEGRLKTFLFAGHVHGYQAERNAALGGYFEEALRKIPR
jgi:hypothetical protein